MGLRPNIIKAYRVEISCTLRFKICLVNSDLVMLVLHNQLIQHDAAVKDGIVSTAMGGVDLIELFPPGGDFPFQGFDGFGFSIRHGLPF